jgi:hypothetical protein
MRQVFGLGLVSVAALLASGCAMCCNPYDEAYGYTGGRWPRTDLCHGRVGSAFAPAGSVETIVSEEVSSEHELHEPPPDSPKSVRHPAADWSGDLSSSK